MANINDPQFDDVREHPGFNARRARVGRQAGARRLGASLWELDPGEAAYPYHAHLAEEELVIVLEGRPSLQTPEGWRELEEGEVASFLRGRDGAHQIVNKTGSLVRFLAISTSGEPEIIIQLDSGKVGAFERDADGGGIAHWFDLDDAKPYFEGVERSDA